MSALKCDSEFSWATGWISYFICLYEMFVAELSEMFPGSLGFFYASIPVGVCVKSLWIARFSSANLLFLGLKYQKVEGLTAVAA